MWKIVSDSSCDLLSSNQVGANILFETVPLTINVGDQQFIDDDTIDINALLHAMKHEKKASISACPSPGNFEDSFADADNIICITMTSGLSGTYNSARVAVETTLEKYPNKKIHLIDSKAAAGTLVLLIEKAAALIADDLSFEEVTRQLDAYNATRRLLFVLGGYDNLVKTGRMTPLAGMLATHLNIRAVCTNTNEGMIEVIQKHRGEKATLRHLVDLMKKEKDLKNLPIVITHCHNEEAANYIKTLLEQENNNNQITIYQCKALTSFYTMEKGILVGF